ncbi:hypothetical protein [Prescottella agglutinans]|uniref:Uncharacterized protein n=1 Tax=Prescottella agglutinans TaxID=1644129 RepID=A0ABT6MJU1_9NOCA|nr:hypothetical protein [Prescottella agglutinans]MDH6284582.1 hypothetical protein [Prescottella agglutinans]
MKRPTLIGALCVAVALAVSGCGGDSSSPGSKDTPATFDDTLPGRGASPSHTFAALDADAAVALATQFIRPYGTFTPAAPNPGRTWVTSWSKLADKPVIDRAEKNFDAIWGWTWDQQVQAQDVMPTAAPSVVDNGFGTLTVRLPAKRYVIGLLAHSVTDGHWQNLEFEVVVGPKTPGNADSGLTVYKADFWPTGGA